MDGSSRRLLTLLLNGVCSIGCNLCQRYFAGGFWEVLGGWGYD
jgi:hypothetical protein